MEYFSNNLIKEKIILEKNKIGFKYEIFNSRKLIDILRAPGVRKLATFHNL